MQAQQNHEKVHPTPLVSFIVTCYNLPVSMLRACIDSILALSLQPSEREIIVVDDGSEESMMDGLMGYADDILYIRKRNGGVSSARNMGMQQANGKFIQFVDGDDLLIPASYNHCVDMARNTEADLILFRLTNKMEGKMAPEVAGPTSGAEHMRTQNIHGSACGYMFCQSIRGNLLFTPGISYGEDEEFTAQLMLHAESLYETSANAYYYRKHSGSVTHMSDKRSIVKRLDDAHTVIGRLHMLADRMPTNERTALQRRVAQLTMDYIYNIIRLTRSRQYLRRKLRTLYDEGLFPLPDKDYTEKYKWFRRMANTPGGISLLMLLIPIMKKEQ